MEATAMNGIRLTNHGSDRIRERVGLPKGCVIKNAERAFEKGLKHSELSGSLKRYVDKLYLEQKHANNIRLYCGSAYLFRGNVLITVIPLPGKYRKQEEKMRAKKEA